MFEVEILTGERYVERSYVTRAIHGGLDFAGPNYCGKLN